MRARNFNRYLLLSFCIASKYKISKIAYACFWFSLISFSSFAQTKFKVFDSESGLSSVSITSIVQDRTGYLWIGTGNGLNRFDGNSFRIYRYSSHDTNSIGSNRINCLAVDKFNRIWIGHESSITCYDQSRNRFTRYQLGSTDNGTSFISFDKYDRVWVGIDGSGLIVLNPESGTVERRIVLSSFINKGYTLAEVRRHNVVNGMVEDSSNNVWLATHDGLYLYDRKSENIKPIRIVEDVPGKHRNDFFRRILDDKHGGFWLSANQGGVCYYSPERKLFNVYQTTLKQYDSYQYLPNTNSVQDIAWKNENEIWVTTWDKGKPLGIFDIQSRAFSFLKLIDSFGNDVTDKDLLFSELFVDKDGVVWVASKLGLVMINPKNSWDFNPIFAPEPTTSVSAIIEDKIFEKNFIGTFGHGLIVSGKDNQQRSFKLGKDPSDRRDYISNLMNTTGDSLWVVSHDEIRLFDKTREKWIDSPALQKLKAGAGAPIPQFDRIIRATSGDYWITSTQKGAYRLRSSDLSFVNYQWNENGNSVCSNYLRDLLEDKFGRIWFASRNAGISIFDPATNTFRTLSNDKRSNSFLPMNAISHMDIDYEGNVWIAALTFGVIKINVVSKDSLNLVTFDHEQLLNSAGEIKVDQKGRVWFTSDQAVHIF
ncbi:MAG TPA: two-component regulator propeller domain-containing protein, partial [Cyclobacteriaceae bacterium]|nr:two-component regulator propeller domain-containing protein [Cyclobacteriaceae bacterium]